MRDGQRVDDALVVTACAWIAILCVALRYLPMADLPQHEAMVSILVHYGDPAFGFADRFELALLGPYLTVYALAAALAHLLPLHSAMGVTVALCTIAPVIGAHVLLRASGRHRTWALLAVPVAFGHIWAWGFLNFLLGVGLAQLALAVLISNARTPTVAGHVGVGTLALLTYFSHLHAFALLLITAPLVVAPRWRGLIGLAAPTVIATAITVTGLGRATAYATLRWQSPADAVRMLPDHLAAGFPAPWPGLVMILLAGNAVVAWLVARRAGRDGDRPGRWLMLAAGLQLVLYFVLPLDLENGVHVSPRQALVIVLFGLLLLPEPRRASRCLAAATALGSLMYATIQLRGFDREARSVDAAIAAIPMNQRVASRIYAPQSSFTHATTFPYLHFAAYYQAARGGDLSYSFASVWNIPVQYRPGHPEHRGALPRFPEWNPQGIGSRHRRFFDYVLFRADEVPDESWLEVVTTSGPWTVARVRR